MRTSPASRTSTFPAGQSKTPAVVFFAFPEDCPPRAPSRISIASDAEPGVDEPAPERADAVEAADRRPPVRGRGRPA